MCDIKEYPFEPDLVELIELNAPATCGDEIAGAATTVDIDDSIVWSSSDHAILWPCDPIFGKPAHEDLGTPERSGA